ncbi:MAG: rhomboid family intramembrane serine protease [Anaerolineales bacterium]|nr:rhomboid family intramembrane serine protease [Anaerolineales bacterium]
MPQVTPLVTYTLLAITILVYVLQMGSQFLVGTDLPALLGVKSNELIQLGQLWRLITPVLLHGSIMHILFNMYALNAFGPGLERAFGHWRFLALYLLSGFAGNVVSFLMSPAASLGSSTAIFGLLGAEGVFLYCNRELFGANARKALISIITVAVANLIIGLSPGIDNWGHVGGLVGGVLFAWFGGPLLRVEGTYPSLHLANERSAEQAWRAGLAVGGLFALLAAVIIFMRRGGVGW